MGGVRISIARPFQLSNFINVSVDGGTDVAATGEGARGWRRGKGERVEEMRVLGGTGWKRELEASRRIMYNIIFYDISFWGALGYR